MNTKFLTASIFTLVSTSMVQAADVVVPEQPEHVASPVVVSPPFSWGGFYFGGQVGGFSSKVSAIVPDVNIPLYPDDDSRKKEWVPVAKQYMPKLSGFLGGIYAGANFDLGNNFILGIDTDIFFTSRDNKKSHFETEEDNGSEVIESGSENGDSTNGSKEKGLMMRVKARTDEGAETRKSSLTFTHTLKQKWTGATRARIGFTVDRIMPYISGGVAYGEFQDIMSTLITGEEPFNKTSDVTKTMIGYTLGGGIDVAMTDNVIVRAEYRYSDFGKKKFGDEIELKYKTNDFRVGIAYKF